MESMNIQSLKACIKAAVLLAVHEAEEKFLGEKQGAARKEWVLGLIKANLPFYNYKVFGVFALAPTIDLIAGNLIEWAVAQLKNGVDVLEKL